MPGLRTMYLQTKKSSDFVAELETLAERDFLCDQRSDRRILIIVQDEIGYCTPGQYCG